jgi:DNA-binding XRE family transcriptional regulator
MSPYKPVVGHTEMVTEWMNDPDFKAEYDALEDEFEILDAFLEARKRTGLTQEEVAKRMGTSRPAVARLESSSSRHSPSLNTLKKYAEAVGCKLQIKFVPIKDI